ncbi:hypothetical protein [Nocardioides panacisoli]|uniref:Serine kinase n=1 Tax=Nocardioides panacisoli TaxID=627624 RepID=A0ABP7IW60_9ACTN
MHNVAGAGKVTLDPPSITREVLGVPVVEGETPEPWDAPVVARPYWWADADRLLFRSDDGASVYVERGAVTLRAPDGESRIANDWLAYATAARALLTLDGRYNLHATLVAAPDGRMVAILGDSRAGKSTTTVELVTRGWGFACDDIAEVVTGPKGALARPVERPVHLSEAAARRLGGDPAVGRWLPEREKRVYAVVGADLTPRPLAAMVLLSTLAAGNQVEVRPVPALQAITTVADSGDRYGVCHLPEHRSAYLRWATELTRTVPLWTVARPAEGDSVAAVADAVASISG